MSRSRPPAPARVGAADGAACAAAAPDALTPLQRGVVVAGMLLVHGALAWVLLPSATALAPVTTLPAVASVRVRMVSPVATTPSATAAPGRQALPRPPAPRGGVPTAPGASPPLTVRPAALAMADAAPTPALPAAAAAAPAAAPGPAADTPPDVPAAAAPPPTHAAPRTALLPPSALQFVEPPVPVYPRLSRRLGESGLVVVRAYVGAEGGAPREVAVETSSGHPRLDAAAAAALWQSRFKPGVHNGRPVEGWALVPVRFELER